MVDVSVLGLWSVIMGAFYFYIRRTGYRVMSAAELHETIDGNGLIVNYKKYKAKKEEIEQLKKDKAQLQEDKAQLQKENAELKQAKEFYEKMSAGWNDLWSKITNGPGPIGFARDDTFTDCLRKLYDYIETCQPVMLEVESARIMYARMNVTHMSSASNARIVAFLTEEAEELYQVHRSLVKRVSDSLKNSNSDREQKESDWEEFSRIDSVLDQLNYMMSVVHNQYKKDVDQLEKLTLEIRKFRSWNAQGFPSVVDVSVSTPRVDVIKKMSENIQFNFRQKNEVVRQIKQRIMDYPQVFRDSFMTDDYLENRDWVSLVVDVMSDFISYINNNCKSEEEESSIDATQEESGIISIQSTFIPGKHFKRQNWRVSYNHIHEQAFCDLTGTGLFKEYYIGITTVDKQSTISVSVENAIFLDAIWHYMQELQIKSGYLYNELNIGIRSNDCTQDMSYTVWNRFMAHELNYNVDMTPEDYKHLQDPDVFRRTSDNKEKYDQLKTRMVNTLDGITDDEMKLNAGQITLRLAADFFWAVRDNDDRQSYFIPFDLHQSPIVTKGLIHSVRRDAKFDEATKKIQEQYRLQNQATYVPGDNSNTEGQNSASVCVVCLDAEATHACLPCGHKCMCETCAGLVLHTTGICPMCREEVTDTIQIFGKRFNPFFIELPV